jgi:hypothetical protein
MSEKYPEILEGWEEATIVSEKGEDFPVYWDNRINGKASKKYPLGKIIYGGSCCYIKPSSSRGHKVPPRTTSLCNFSDPNAPITGTIEGIPLCTAKIIIPSIRANSLTSPETKTAVKLRVTEGILHYRNQVRIELKERSTIIITHGSDIVKKIIESLSDIGQDWYPNWPDGMIYPSALNEEEIKRTIQAIENTEITVKKRR